MSASSRGDHAQAEECAALKLLIQPDDGIAPILSAIKAAKESIEIVIFRFDRPEIEAALKTAVGRGVHVHALIAYINRGGEQNLRSLEMRFLEAGVTVARSADDLLRYHDKMLLVDRKTAYVLSFNYTAHDIDFSRGFGLVTNNPKWVAEAARLFEADSKRQPYTPSAEEWVVSPLNARKVLSSFLRKAKKELLIYDPKIADREMLRILNERLKSGVVIRIIGRLGKRANGLNAKKLLKLRLHTRTIIRDRAQAFVGSQSLRKAELDSRRELGMIVRDAKIVSKLAEVFDSDWKASEPTTLIDKLKDNGKDVPDQLKKAVKVIAKEIPPLETTVKRVMKKIVAEAGAEALETEAVQETVKKVVKRVVKEAVKEVVEKAPEAKAS
jgi:cardiolipin synthase A/B